MAGLAHIWRNEPNARIHLVFSVVVLLAGLALGLNASEMAAIFFAILVVFLAEIINSAFEKTLDIVSPGHHPTVKIIKDMAAGAVLVAAAGSVVIGLIIFIPAIMRLVNG